MSESHIEGEEGYLHFIFLFNLEIKTVREHAECKTAGLLPGDFVDLSLVHGAEDRGVSHSFPDPQLDADAAVEEEHGGQRQQEQRHHDEGGVNLTVQQ